MTLQIPADAAGEKFWVPPKTLKAILGSGTKIKGRAHGILGAHMGQGPVKAITLASMIPNYHCIRSHI